MIFYNAVTTTPDADTLEKMGRYVYENFYGPLGLMMADGKLDSWIYYLVAAAIVISGYFLGS